MLDELRIRAVVVLNLQFSTFIAVINRDNSIVPLSSFREVEKKRPFQLESNDAERSAFRLRRNILPLECVPGE